jgi:hypothetical protein
VPMTVDADSRAGRLLRLLQSTPDVPWSITDLAATIGVSTTVAAQALYGGVRGAGDASPWRQVDRPSRGTWVYRTSGTDRVAMAWVPTYENGDVVLLRAPDGVLWIARPVPCQLTGTHSVRPGLR